MTNQANGQASSVRRQQKNKKVEKESVVKTRSGRLFKNQLGSATITMWVFHRWRTETREEDLRFVKVKCCLIIINYLYAPNKTCEFNQVIMLSTSITIVTVLSIGRLFVGRLRNFKLISQISRTHKFEFYGYFVLLGGT